MVFHTGVLCQLRWRSFKLSKICDYKIVPGDEVMETLIFTSSSGVMPAAASKQAPEIHACLRSSGQGASHSLPFGSDPITLKYQGMNLDSVRSQLQVLLQFTCRLQV
jgi:hypothetical protein